MWRVGLFSLVFISSSVSPTLADQPIMNMMPRWDGGYGIQFFHESYWSNDLLSGSSRIANPMGLELERHRLRIEGVYTWDKSIRVAFKQPYVWSQRRTIMKGGKAVTQRNSGWDDFTLILPLKKYFNRDGYSGSWTLAPQVRFPTGSQSGDFPISDGSWDFALSAGYEYENPTWYAAVGATHWWNNGHEADLFQLEIDLGWRLRDNAMILWETEFDWSRSGATRIESGPVLYWRFTDTVHTRISWKRDIYQKVEGVAPGHGDTFRIGVGFVY